MNRINFWFLCDLCKLRRFRKLTIAFTCEPLFENLWVFGWKRYLVEICALCRRYTVLKNLKNSFERNIFLNFARLIKTGKIPTSISTKTSVYTNLNKCEVCFRRSTIFLWISNMKIKALDREDLEAAILPLFHLFRSAKEFF